MTAGFDISDREARIPADALQVGALLACDGVAWRIYHADPLPGGGVQAFATAEEDPGAVLVLTSEPAP